MFGLIDSTATWRFGADTLITLIPGRGAAINEPRTGLRPDRKGTTTRDQIQHLQLKKWTIFERLSKEKKRKKEKRAKKKIGVWSVQRITGVAQVWCAGVYVCSCVCVTTLSREEIHWRRFVGGRKITRTVNGASW